MGGKKIQLRSTCRKWKASDLYIWEANSSRKWVEGKCKLWSVKHKLLQKCQFLTQFKQNNFRLCFQSDSLCRELTAGTNGIINASPPTLFLSNQKSLYLAVQHQNARRERRPHQPPVEPFESQ